MEVECGSLVDVDMSVCSPIDFGMGLGVWGMADILGGKLGSAKLLATEQRFTTVYVIVMVFTLER